MAFMRRIASSIAKTSKTSEFSVRYTGFVLVPYLGREEIIRGMRKFYNIYKTTIKLSPPVVFRISPSSFVISGKYFDAQRILYTKVDKSKPNLVCFIYDQGGIHSVLECHVLLCSSKSEAKSLCSVLREVSVQEPLTGVPKETGVAHNDHKVKEDTFWSPTAKERDASDAFTAFKQRKGYREF